MNASPEGPQINFELPPQPASPEAGEQGAEQAVEAPPARRETVGKQPSQPVALPPVPTDVPAADQPIVAVPPQDLTGPVRTPHATTQDSDRIEPVWINKVKNVVASTQDDPYRQKDEMSKVKADYIQKRFNKTIKTDEAAA